MVKSTPWSSIISWCIAVGVPMTPLAGTWLGYALLVFAAVLGIWRGWVHINQQNWQSKASRFLVIAPTFLLCVLAVIWSSFGGLPALLLERQIENFSPSDYNDVVTNYGVILPDKLDWHLNVLRLEQFSKSRNIILICSASEDPAYMGRDKNIVKSRTYPIVGSDLRIIVPISEEMRRFGATQVQKRVTCFTMLVPLNVEPDDIATLNTAHKLGGRYAGHGKTLDSPMLFR